MNEPKRGATLTSTKGKASHTNTIQATSDNIEAFRDKISIYMVHVSSAPISTV